MRLSTEVKNLASLVTFRQLYNDGKSDIYFIVSRFVEGIVIGTGLYCFGITDISEKIRAQYGFCIPDYVIQTSLKKIDYVSRENNQYTVDISKLPNSSIDEQCQNAISKSDNVIRELEKFAEEKRGELSAKEKEQLVKEFCAFLLDESNGNHFSDVISAYIVEKQDDKDIMAMINTIKEGAVLYAGINHNSNVSERRAWNKPIILYAEIEILFHLAGYNGEVFKRHVEDLLSLIYEMNSKSGSHNIKVRYFEDVKIEIDKFFTKAENIVLGNDIVDVENYAMNTIVNGCKTAADVIEKKAAFFSLLKAKGIVQADGYNYYEEANQKYNLESEECIAKYELSDDKFRYIKHINYVNILRKENDVDDLKSCQHIVLTEVGKMLFISNDMAVRKIPLAINMSGITNRLWFDLNKGFGAKDFPSNFSVLLKAKIVLSSMISQSVSEKYEKAYDDYRNKKLDAEQMADVILSLREEAKKPEEIEIRVLDDVLDFLSEKDLSIYQSEKERLDSELKERDRAIEEYKAILKKKDENILNNSSEKNQLILEKEELREKAKTELRKRYSDCLKIKEKADRMIDKRTKVFKNGFRILVVLYYIGIIIAYIFLNATYKTYLISGLAIVPPFVGCVASFITNKKVNIFEVVNILTEKRKKHLEKKYYKLFEVNLDKIKEMENELAES
ncbi:MAG: hypothetical protein MJZ11_02270 [Lachnospiraceae bacterium]|nr:hypothetical protein [Lachnospiraceae bacterium]